MKSHLSIKVCGVGLLLAAAALTSLGQEWTRFRGPNGTGLSQAKGIPSRWSTNNIQWKAELPGAGHSSPVIWSNSVFLTSADDAKGKLYLHCLDANSGAARWRKEFSLVSYPLHKFNTFASSTPAVDEQHVYISWLSRGHYKLSAFDHSGAPVWEQDLGAFESQHGSGTSPIVYGDSVILAKDPDGESYLMSVNARDGALRWQSPLHGSRADYSTPCLYQANDGKPLLIFTSTDDGFIALNPDTGKTAWRLAEAFNQRCVSSPVLAGDLIVGSCGSGGGGNYVVAMRPPGRSAVAKPERAYQVRKSAPYVPTGLALGNLLFLWSDGGIVTCLESASGETKWQERVGGDFFSSPICIENRLFNVSATGDVVVLAAADQFKELARNPLQEECRATPAVSGGRLFVRTTKHLYAIGQPASNR